MKKYTMKKYTVYREEGIEAGYAGSKGGHEVAVKRGLDFDKALKLMRELETRTGIKHAIG